MANKYKGGPGSGEKDGHPFRGNQYTDSVYSGDGSLVSKADFATKSGKLSYKNDFDEVRRRDRLWDATVKLEVSLGKVSPEDAERLGLYGVHGKWGKLPDEMWHVTTAKDEVLKSGLKTRSELSQLKGGHGLGGGPDDTISFTTDRSIAVAIKESILEARKFAAGEITPDDLIRMATEGSSGAERPFIGDIARFYDHSWKNGDDLPYSLKADIDGKIVKSSALAQFSEDKLESGDVPIGDGFIDSSGKRRWNSILRDNPDKEDIEYRRFQLYKLFASMREHAGGPFNPLFFSSDSKALSLKSPDQIAIIRVKPKKGTLGVRVSALAEIRTFTGKIVDVDGVED